MFVKAVQFVKEGHVMSCVLDEPGVSSDTRFEFAGDSPSQRAFEALAMLDAAAIESMDRDDLDSVMQARRALAAFADSVDIRVARLSRQLAAEGRSESATGVLRDAGRRSGRDAAAAAGREQACEQLPSFETALAAGTVSSGHLDAVANATAKLDEAAKAEFTARESELLDTAAESSRIVRTALPRRRPLDHRRRRRHRTGTPASREQHSPVERHGHGHAPPPRRARS